MNIHITYGDHAAEGTWKFDNDTLRIIIPKLEDWREESILATHLLIEALICRANNVLPSSMDKYAELFNRKQTSLLVGSDVDMEDEPNCPWSYEHCLARSVERMLAAVIGVPWFDYLDSLRSAKRKP